MNVPARSGVPKILVADDDDALRDVLADVLRKDGYDVETVASGEEAIRVLEESSRRGSAATSVDLVLTDVHMEGMSGVRVGEKIREAKWNVPLIFITGSSEACLSEASHRLDAALLPKPFALPFLRRLVLTAIAASHAKKRARQTV